MLDECSSQIYLNKARQARLLCGDSDYLWDSVILLTQWFFVIIFLFVKVFTQSAGQENFYKSEPSW